MAAVEKAGDKAEAAAGAASSRKKKLVILGAAAAALLLGGGGGAYMMLGGSAEAAEGDHGAKAEAHGDEGDDDAAEGGGHGGADAEAKLPLDVPPILVNLRTPDGAPHFLKVHVMLVPGPKSNLEDLKKKLPILMDAYQPYLRELRPEDLSGSAAVYRVKEELMLRARDGIGPGQVDDVLVQELVQQ